jgi:alpha-1,2-mannosyltransferase
LSVAPPWTPAQPGAPGGRLIPFADAQPRDVSRARPRLIPFLQPTTERHRAGASWLVIALVGAAAVFSLAVGYDQLLRLHELHGVLEYDDGVWFGSAVRMANGALPYRDFVLDQPPGVPLLVLPFAFLSRLTGTREALGIARLITPLAQAVTVVAAGWLVRHRGRIAVAVSAGVTAIYPWALIDQRTVMLEPYCAMWCLLGLNKAFVGDELAKNPRRLAAAGFAFGLAASCKLFAVLPLAVLTLAFILSSDRFRRLLALFAGAAAAAILVCGPFFVLAPAQFIRQVITTQLVRSTTAEPSIWDRLFSLIGLFEPTHVAGYPDDSHRADVLIVALFAILVLAGWVLHATHARWGAGDGGKHRTGRSGLVTHLDLVSIGIVVLTAAALMEPPAYYSHYSAFFAPFLAVSLGLTASNLAGSMRSVISIIIVTVLLLAGSVHAVRIIDAVGAGSGPFNAASLDSLIPPGSCVVSDNAPILILANRFTSARPDCPLMVDAFGTTLSVGDGDPATSPRAATNGSVAAWTAIIAHAHYLVLTYGYHAKRIPWTKPLVAYARDHFRILRRASPLVAVRR